MIGPLAADAGLEVDLEAAVPAGHRGYRLDGSLRQRGPPEVGVQHHAGGVDDRLQRPPRHAPRSFRNLGAPVVRHAARPARARRHRFPCRGEHHAAREWCRAARRRRAPAAVARRRAIAGAGRRSTGRLRSAGAGRNPAVPPAAESGDASEGVGLGLGGVHLRDRDFQRPTDVGRGAVGIADRSTSTTYVVPGFPGLCRRGGRAPYRAALRDGAIAVAALIATGGGWRHRGHGRRRGRRVGRAVEAGR